jgi:hypothetical protein
MNKHQAGRSPYEKDPSPGERFSLLGSLALLACQSVLGLVYEPLILLLTHGLPDQLGGAPLGDLRRFKVRN